MRKHKHTGQNNKEFHRSSFKRFYIKNTMQVKKFFVFIQNLKADLRHYLSIHSTVFIF